MNKNIDDFVESLQNQIDEETRLAYGDIAFKRWRNPLYMGGIDDADGYGCVKGTCGDTVQIFLKVDNEKVKAASFKTDGCGASAVCGSFAAELAIGRSLNEIFDISGESILKKAGGLPEADQHCAFLFADALHEALNDYMIKQKTE